jgi:hypothetical protein
VVDDNGHVVLRGKRQPHRSFERSSTNAHS